ncbi:UNVERIFIED_CONTAM: hypothetical protein GTU68_067354 [Idotea baltica]|nr:hypothetical protein [Idotea baltica]
MRFRRNLERIGELLAYEVSKTLHYADGDILSPLGVARMPVLQDQIVVSTVLRAGLPLHQGLLNYFDKAENAFIASYRKVHKDGSFDIALEYFTSPSLTDKVVILSDVMIASGASIESALEVILRTNQPKKIHIVGVIAVQESLDRLQRLYPKVDIWIAAIDNELTAKSYIVPGLGDAGDLAYGSKI